MLLRFLFAASTMFLTVITVFPQTPTPDAGVSQTLAKWRPANYSDVRYKLNLTLEKMSPVLKGTIEVSVKNNADQIVLDWRKIRGKEDLSTVSNVSVNGKAVVLSSDFSRLSSSEEPAKAGTQNAGTLSFYETNEHLVFKDGVVKGENVIKLDFTSPIATSGAAITRYVDKEDAAEYVYSLFVPSDASTAFPVFDQPDLKARFQLNVKAPKDWDVITNTRMITIFDGDSDIPEKNNMVKNGYVVFEQTKPISTYVFAFAAGEFKEFVEGQDYTGQTPVKTSAPNEIPSVSFVDLLAQHNYRKKVSLIYVRKSQAEKFKQHAAEVFRLNREGVKFLESWFDYKFPFPKYDLVLLPEFPFGGMEHAGATFLREDRVIFPTEPTKNDYITRANVIFHEAAHQWFGDTVTMRWFDDLWLKEGFAEFMAYKTLEKVMPEYNAWKIFYERNKQLAYLTDSTRGTTPIYQEIPNLSAAKSAYGNIVYRKAPSFLRQAEFYLGEDKFQTAVRAFLKKHEFANAEWTDLVKEFETATGRDLKDWANVWVKQRGLPKITFEIRQDITGTSYATVWNPSTSKLKTLKHTSTTSGVSVKQADVLNEGRNWTMKAKFISKFKDGHIEEIPVDFYEHLPPGIVGVGYVHKSNELPLFVFPNYQDYGYGIFLLDEKSRAYVLANIQNEKDDFLRTMMWGGLWDSGREAELAPKDYVALVIKNINVETDESTIQTLLARVSTAMNYYLSDKQREELVPQVEAVLIGRMREAKTLGQRITFYRAYLNVASSDYSQEVLKKILKSGGKPIELESNGDAIGQMPALELFPLKTKDKFDIITKLLILENKKILGNDEAEKLLAELEKTETSDEAKRYAYAARAGIATVENKQKFFSDFVSNKEISESYIEAAFVPFNSTKHADLTLPFLENALKELPNLKRSRKIFFINGWLSAFIGGQKSEQALAIVNKFLADNPILDKDLRLKVLEVADGLERAVKIRKRFPDTK